MTPLETYLRSVSEIHASGAGVKETSYYGALETLLNEVGKKLKPRVRCILSLANRGAGLPDGGLFTPDQFPKSSALEPLEGRLPARGAIEVKPPGEDAGVTAASDQVSKYWKRYKQVLVTNLRDFVLVASDSQGAAVKLETYGLAPSAKAFWAAAATPRKTDADQGERFVEFLKRVMLHAADLSAPEDVAWFLASYAREAKGRIEGVDLPALSSVRSALEEALGLKFEGEKGEHFFRSSLVQTLFYGVFSAWVLWSKQHPPTSKDRFDWYTTARYLRVPMISKLFYLVADPQALEALGLAEVLGWAGSVLNRVDRRSFFERFQEAHAVQYFYEPFLEAFDPELRKELGVWYTPPEIVKYMVERVDAVLRRELGLPLGLADKNVYVLDPCCGTGSYLVEVLGRIHRTLKEKGEDGLLASDLKDAARHRVFGFEILPAPFVVSHLQLGLLLQNLGAPLSEAKKERVGVYLTNALTGWEPPKGPKQHLMFSELEEERDAAEHVKRDVPILVILGNPPYNAFAGVSPQEEQGLVEPYKQGLISKWGIKKFNLDDLYTRFFRLAERRIAEKTGRGVVCYISNFSYLGDPSFVVMRQRFLKEFDRLWFDCMNGDSRETGKLTPEGKPDPSVFSTEYNREGIRVGTAIGLLVRKGSRDVAPAVQFRQFWGVSKRDDLVRSLDNKEFEEHYEPAQPVEANRYSFHSQAVAADYLAWPKLAVLCAVPPFNGPVERRGNSLIVFEGEQNKLALLQPYLDPSESNEEIRSLAPPFMKSSGEFRAEKARELLLGNVTYDKTKIVRYPFKPFDLRLAYLDGAIQPLFSRPSPELLAQREIAGNSFFITRDTADKDPEGPPFYFSRLVCDYDCISGHTRHFPRFVVPAKKKKAQHGQGTIKLHSKPAKANVSVKAQAYLAQLGITEPSADIETAGLVWMHALAVGYSPTYLTENADGIRQDWPRIPLPDSKEALLASAALGQQIAALLDTETPLAAAAVPASLETIAAFKLASDGPLDESHHFAVTAGWGHAGKGGVTMPGKGKTVERDYTAEERRAVGDAARLLGAPTLDVYLNEAAYWSNIPARVWDYTIGGYQVIKKWLSYRERKLLGRPLSKDEVRYVQEMTRRIAAILLLEPALDENYRRVKEHAYPWESPEAAPKIPS